jgi:hypothetical protein
MMMNGFFRCDCGKAHACGGVWTTSLCACGRDLFKQMMEKR